MEPITPELLQAPPFRADDPRVEALDQLLELRAMPHGGMDLEQLDGFLSALMVSPRLVMPSEWQPLVWGKTPPRWESLEDATQAHSLLMALWNTIAKRVRHPGDEVPVECLLFWWLPEEPMDAHGDDVDIGAGWAQGFLLGMDLCSDGWDAWIEQAPWIAEIEAHVESLATGDYLVEGGDEVPVTLSYQERLELFASLPDMLYDLNCHRLEQMTSREPVRVEALPGRNDPCPCGSGKKFKKCCGEASRLH